MVITSKPAEMRGSFRVAFEGMTETDDGLFITAETMVFIDHSDEEGTISTRWEPMTKFGADPEIEYDLGSVAYEVALDDWTENIGQYVENLAAEVGIPSLITESADGFLYYNYQY